MSWLIAGALVALGFVAWSCIAVGKRIDRLFDELEADMGQEGKL